MGWSTSRLPSSSSSSSLTAWTTAVVCPEPEPGPRTDDPETVVERRRIENAWESQSWRRFPTRGKYEFLRKFLHCQVDWRSSRQSARSISLR